MRADKYVELEAMERTIIWNPSAGGDPCPPELSLWEERRLLSSAVLETEGGAGAGAVPRAARG